MSKLTDTQLVILSTASRRNDRGVDLPANVTGEAVRKAVDKLIRTGLLEEVNANGSLLAWRRDVDAGPMALRITKQGLEAIGVKDDAVGAPTETSVRMRGKLPMHLTPRCGARTRSGNSCRAPAMPNGRCRMHGGPSPGAPKGNKNALKHGLYTAEAITRRREMSGLMRAMRAFVRNL